MSNCNDYPTPDDSKRWKNNANSTNEFVTSPNDTFTDQDGDVHLTMTGIRNSSNVEALAGSQGASLVGTSDGNNVQSNIDSLDSDVEALKSGQGSGVIGYATQAELYADVNYPDKSIGYVTNDTTPTKNGTYLKVGVSGSGRWVQSSDDIASQAYQKATSNEDFINRNDQCNISYRSTSRPTITFGQTKTISWDSTLLIYLSDKLSFDFTSISLPPGTYSLANKEALWWNADSQLVEFGRMPSDIYTSNKYILAYSVEGGLYGFMADQYFQDQEIQNFDNFDIQWGGGSVPSLEKVGNNFEIKFNSGNSSFEISERDSTNYSTVFFTGYPGTTVTLLPNEALVYKDSGVIEKITIGTNEPRQFNIIIAVNFKGNCFGFLPRFISEKRKEVFTTAAYKKKATEESKLLDITVDPQTNSIILNNQSGTDRYHYQYDSNGKETFFTQTSTITIPSGSFLIGSIYDEFNNESSYKIEVVSNISGDDLVLIYNSNGLCSHGAYKYIFDEEWRRRPVTEGMLNVTGEFSLSGFQQGTCFVNSEFWRAIAAPDDHSSFSNLYRFDATSDGFPSLTAMTHNISHMNTMDYNPKNNSLLIGNGSKDYDLPLLGWIFPNASQWPSIGVIDINTIEKVTLDFSSIQESKCQLLWGGGLHGENQTIYMITNDNKVFREIALGTGGNDFGSGQFITGKPDGEYNGSWVEVNKWTYEYPTINGDGKWVDGSIVTTIRSEDKVTLRKFTPQSDGTMLASDVVFYYFDKSTGQKFTGLISPQGLDVRNGSYYISVLLGGGNLFKCDLV